MADELIEENVEDTVTVNAEEVVGEYPEIAAHYKAGVELTDDELDAIADVAISVVRLILSHFDADDSPIDEYGL